MYNLFYMKFNLYIFRSIQSKVSYRLIIRILLRENNYSEILIIAIALYRLIIL